MNCLVRFLNYYESAIGALVCWQGRVQLQGFTVANISSVLTHAIMTTSAGVEKFVGEEQRNTQTTSPRMIDSPSTASF